MTDANLPNGCQACSTRYSGKVSALECPHCKVTMESKCFSPSRYSGKVSALVCLIYKVIMESTIFFFKKEKVPTPNPSVFLSTK
jgi:hypothetical protein